MGCQLIPQKPQNSSLKGTTLFTQGDCIAPSAVYLPANFGMMADMNVILWFHGHHVSDIQQNVFGPDGQKGNTMLRESVDKAGQSVILIVPYLGRGGVDTDYGLRKLANGKTGVRDYLDQMMDLIGNQQGIGSLDTSNIDQLILGCHSGSDWIMRQATDKLGDNLKKNNLKECWGFDCINSGASSGFGPWADALPWVYSYFYVAGGSIDYHHFPSYLIYAYGTPQKPKSPRMNKAILAAATNNPDLTGVPDDQVLECLDVIQAKAQSNQPLSPFEKQIRLVADPLLDTSSTAWETEIKKHSLKGHYKVVEDLLPIRINGLFSAKPAAPKPCVAVKPPAPPPKPHHPARHKVH